MVNAKPPQERATANFDSNPTQNIDVVQLLYAAERALQRQVQSRELARRFEEDGANAEEEVTCCIGGRSTRQIPCRNRNYWACPFRNLDR